MAVSTSTTSTASSSSLTTDPAIAIAGARTSLLSSALPLSTISPDSAIGHHHFGKAPYLSQVALLGEVPSKSVDVPITSVFLVLFIVGAISNMMIFRKNKAQGRLFMPSFFLYVFCMARTLSCALRISWAFYPTNASLSIAAFIFVSAGVLIIFVVNLIFAQRIVRAIQPRIGWSPAFKISFVIIYGLTVLLLIATVICIVHSHYTLNPDDLRIDLHIEQAAITYFLCLAFLPLLLVYVAQVLPRTRRPEKFGTGSWRSKVRILTLGAALCTFGAGFRTGSNFMNPRRADDPAWYHSKVCFYLFNFTIEVLVVYLYLITRVDKRFYIPNGCKTDGDYTRPRQQIPSSGASSSTVVVGEPENLKRKGSLSSYARIFDGSSSTYSWREEEREREVNRRYASDGEEDHERHVRSRSISRSHSPSRSYLSQVEINWGSESTLQLPPAVAPSRIRVVDMQEAPYVDIDFLQERDHYGQHRGDDWFRLETPRVSGTFER
ncbi:uncharacterized protein PV06_04652 [Exophiala oligosperma]|uniref:Uncharacterized protein n=1 Tax=Exophiala oligosperma TaxID=215243 RepID=A0A0D2AUV1_9EURO|nr:uncharacterized protein PV06_04652 [Exophiala oligosperma]KIW43561.1 hypothetical protein PV06_04652 [Exophiala oligosperma]